jgi:hypothetical protein
VILLDARKSRWKLVNRSAAARLTMMAAKTETYSVTDMSAAPRAVRQKHRV